MKRWIVEFASATNDGSEMVITANTCKQVSRQVIEADGVTIELSDSIQSFEESAA